MSGSIGLGDLALAHGLTQAGFGVGTFFIILGAFLNFWALNCLAGGGCKTNSLNYSDLIFKKFGKV